MERRLAAILAIDVVGYSRLMEAHEVRTLVALKSHREALIDPKIAEHNGRVVKLTGDGALVEFGSVVDAFNFTVDVQRAVTERNAGVPEDCRITYRIGTNIGEFVIDSRDTGKAFIQ